MTLGAVDEELLLALVRSGNTGLAEREWARAARFQREQGREAVATWRELRERMACEPLADRAILAPLPSSEMGRDGVCTEVVVSGSGDTPSHLDPDARSAVDAALATAWEIVGGRGSPPTMAVQLPQSLIAGSVHGDSLFLPVLLAAVGTLAGERLPGNVAATGAFSSAIALLDEKLGLLAGAPPGPHGYLELLVATSVKPQAIPATPGVRVSFCQSPVDAVQIAYGHVPWHPSAETSRIHLHSGLHKSASFGAPPGFDTALPLPSPLDASHLKEARDELFRLLQPGKRHVITVAGPVVLGAWLGCACRNAPASIRVSHKGEAWWHNRSRWQPPERREARDERWVLVKKGATPGQAVYSIKTPPGPSRREWELVPLPGEIVTSEVGRLVRLAAADIHGSAQHVHLAIDAPLAFAWALADLLQPAGRVSFYHFDMQAGAYERWFDNTDARI